jgi:hypothetical protein
MHKGYKRLDISTGRIYISRDVIFDESVFPFVNPQPDLVPGSPAPNYFGESSLGRAAPTLCRIP